MQGWRHGSHGFRLHYRAHAAYLSSALSTLHNPLISSNYSPLSLHLQSNYQWICKTLDLTSIPPNLGVLNSHDLALSLTTNRNRKVQATITCSLLSNLRQRLRSLCSTPLHSIDLNLYDCTHILAITSRSQMPRVFTASLWHKHNRIGTPHNSSYTSLHGTATTTTSHNSYSLIHPSSSMVQPTPPASPPSSVWTTTATSMPQPHTQSPATVSKHHVTPSTTPYVTSLEKI